MQFTGIGGYCTASMRIDGDVTSSVGTRFADWMNEDKFKYQAEKYAEAVVRGFARVMMWGKTPTTYSA